MIRRIKSIVCANKYGINAERAVAVNKTSPSTQIAAEAEELSPLRSIRVHSGASMSARTEASAKTHAIRERVSRF